MKPDAKDKTVTGKHPLTSELLLLPDGRILVHNLTPAFAGLLKKLNPDDEQIRLRSQPSAEHPT